MKIMKKLKKDIYKSFHIKQKKKKKKNKCTLPDIIFYEIIVEVGILRLKMAIV